MNPRPDQLSVAERSLLSVLRTEAALERTSSAPDTDARCFTGAIELLTYGRLFTPALWPGNTPPPGELGACYAESRIHARSAPEAIAYVEGWALTSGRLIHHAWCATADGIIQDPTWHSSAEAYLGIPFLVGAAVDLALDYDTPLLNHTGPDSPLTQWRREGIPEHILMPAGRVLPDHASSAWT